MRCVVIATGYRADLEPLVQHRPSVLFKVVNKPILFHIFDFLAKQNIKQCDIFICHLPDQVERAVGDGNAWGIDVSYHLLKESTHPFKMIRTITKSWGTDPVLFVQGDVFPHIEHFNANRDIPTLFQFPSKEWTGWGIIPAQFLADIDPSALTEDLPNLLKPAYNVHKAQYHLSCRTFKDYISSNLRPLTHKIGGFIYPTTAHEVQKGVWISRSVAIHRDVKIEPPVFIGENCRIMNDVEIGPDVIIENNCIIDEGSKIKHSMILKKSYVGEHLEIRDSIVDHNLLINMTHETAIRMKDDFILGAIHPRPLFRYPLNLIVRCFAAFAFLVLLPIYFYLRKRCDLTETQMLQLPAPIDVHHWQTFPYCIFTPKEGKALSPFLKYFRKIPLLPAIMKGHIHLVGVAPRSPEETNLLPEDWKKLYLKSKVGLITLAALDQGEEASSDDIYAAEAFYATQMSLLLDIKLILRWLKLKIFWWVG